VIEDGDFYYIQFEEIRIPTSLIKALRNEGRFDKG
jgi:hypothetical protein